MLCRLEKKNTGSDGCEKDGKQEKPRTVKVKLTFKEKQEYASIEEEIEKLELEKQELEQLFQSENVDYQALGDKHKRYEELENILVEKMERWEYLASKS